MVRPRDVVPQMPAGAVHQHPHTIGRPCCSPVRAQARQPLAMGIRHKPGTAMPSRGADRCKPERASRTMGRATTGRRGCGAPPLLRVCMRPNRPSSAAMSRTGRVSSAARVSSTAWPKAGTGFSTSPACRDGGGEFAAVAPLAALAGGVTGDRRCWGRQGARARLQKLFGWAGPWLYGRRDCLPEKAPKKWALPPQQDRRVAVGLCLRSPGRQVQTDSRLQGEHGQSRRTPRAGTRCPGQAQAPPRHDE